MQTPYYVIHKQKLNALIGELKSALNANWSNSIIGYSFKTNSLPWIVEYMKKQGCYAEVVSKDEYRIAEKMGFENYIIYNGPVKSKETFLEAARKKCILNIDSKREVRWLLETDIPANVGIRVNFDLEKYCQNESQCGCEGGRFGFCYENGELENIILTLEGTKAKIKGLHLHCSSKTRSLNIYKAIANVCCQIKAKYNLDLDYVDIGGGFFGGVQGKPEFNEYIKNVSDILQQCFDKEKTKLIVEPGMSLIGAPIDYVTSIIDVKDTSYNRFVVTDGSRTNIDPLMKKSSYSYHIVYRDDDRKKYKRQVISGFTCMENDRIIVLEDELELKEYDQIRYEKVGAYTMCLTPLFIDFFPDVYLEDDGNLTKIRDRWNVDKVL